MDTTYNFNFAHCIKEAHNFGSDVYTNICNGATSVVNWGSQDWFYNIFGAIVLSVGIMIMVGMVTIMGYASYTMYKETKEYV